MVTPQSPIFNGLDDDLYNDAKFAHEINDKMRVPKRIKATGEYSDEDLLLSNQNGMINSWNYHAKIDMNVPDRIVMLGNDQHLETRSAPREIVLENSILPKNPLGTVRVQTPPRTITLNDHHFPSASEENSPSKTPTNNNNDDDGDFDENYIDNYGNEVVRSQSPYIRANGHAKIGFQTHEANSVESESQLTTGGASKRSQQLYDTSLISQRDGTPIGDLTPPEEVLYLRRQLAKLNRRVLNIEIVNDQLMQREKIVYCLGLAYFVLKAILWLNRN